MTSEADVPKPQSPQDLIATAERVIGEVRALRGDLASKRSLRKAWRVVAFDVVLSLVGLALWYSQVQTNHRLQDSLKQNYVTAQQQAETRVRVLCPLYTILLAAVQNPASPTPGTPEQRARVAKAAETIRKGYTTLGCTPALSDG